MEILFLEKWFPCKASVTWNLSEIYFGFLAYANNIQSIIP